MPDDPEVLAIAPFKFCGCGQPEKVLAELIATLDWAASDLASRPMYEGPLLPLYVLDQVGFTEHGGSVFGSWLTDEGREWLANWGDQFRG